MFIYHVQVSIFRCLMVVSRLDWSDGVTWLDWSGGVTLVGLVRWGYSAGLVRWGYSAGLVRWGYSAGLVRWVTRLDWLGGVTLVGLVRWGYSAGLVRWGYIGWTCQVGFLGVWVFEGGYFVGGVVSLKLDIHTKTKAITAPITKAVRKHFQPTRSQSNSQLVLL